MIHSNSLRPTASRWIQIKLNLSYEKMSLLIHLTHSEYSIFFVQTHKPESNYKTSQIDDSLSDSRRRRADDFLYEIVISSLCSNFKWHSTKKTELCISETVSQSSLTFFPLECHSLRTTIRIEFLQYAFYINFHDISAMQSTSPWSSYSMHRKVNWKRPEMCFLMKMTVTCQSNLLSIT